MIEKCMGFDHIVLLGLSPHLFVIHGRYYTREDTDDAVKYISGTILDDRPIRVDYDWGFQEGRQWGRGRSGGQVRNKAFSTGQAEIDVCFGMDSVSAHYLVENLVLAWLSHLKRRRPSFCMILWDSAVFIFSERQHNRNIWSINTGNMNHGRLGRD
jgi:hypothetical protein